MINNKSPHSSNSSHKEIDALRQKIHPKDPEQEAALDPAVERVRKKLMYLMISFVSITLILILAVLAAIIYKILVPQSEKILKTPAHTDPHSIHKKIPQIAQYTIPLPKGAKIISQSLSETALVLRIIMPDGQTKLIVYNYYTGEILATFSTTTSKYSEDSSSKMLISP
ncbi:hypothetical protein [Bartonella ancashensis]|uniref:Putative fimbrial subunit PilA n=1 Tax=Bartonella ancashensis TaxID=1318743 RepID=A0A0M4M513_9HYPH|nr:hypothetical protein [Bartonella ancashensis]ALE03054.1 putative fimbrial subunit PilA [Bartonella ancashensis]